MAGAGAEGLVVLLWGPDSRVRLTVAWALLPIVLVLCEVLVVQAFLGMVTALEGLLLLLLLLWVIAEAAGLVGMKVWDPLARGQAGVGGQRPVVGLGGGGCAALVGVGPLPTGLATGGVGRGGGEGLGLLGEVAALGEGQGGGKVTLGFLPLELGVCQGWWGLRQLLLDVEGMSPEGQLGTLLWVLPAGGHHCLFHQVLVIFAHPAWQGLRLRGWWLGAPPGLQALLARVAARVGAAVLDSVAREGRPPWRGLRRGQAFAGARGGGRAPAALVTGEGLRAVVVLGQQTLSVAAQPGLAWLPVVLQARRLL